MPEATRTQPSVLYVEIGKRISHFRKDLSLSQAELAAKVGMKQPLIAGIEIGIRRISLEALLKVCEALHISVNELLPLPQQQPRKRGPTPKMQRQLERVQSLPEDKQKLISDLIDSVAGPQQD